MAKLVSVGRDEWMFEQDNSRSDMPDEVRTLLEQKFAQGQFNVMAMDEIMQEILEKVPTAFDDVGISRYDELFAISDLLQAGVVHKAFKQAQDYVKRYYDDPEGFRMLASVYSEQGDDIAMNLCLQRSFDLYVKDFPKKFNWKTSKLEWGFLENRDFLDTLYLLALSYITLEQHDTGIALAEQLVDINPVDNQGMRDTLAESYLKTGAYKKIIALAKRYPDDSVSPAVLYGEVLAYCYLGDEKNAKTCWQKAIDNLPLVAKELTKKRHTLPKTNAHEGYVTLGGADQAYYYWQEFKDYWENNELAQQLVEAHRAKK